MSTFALERVRESPGAFHARDLLVVAGGPLVVVNEPSSGAVVLGSAQRVDVVDTDACHRAGVEVVRRRSGGGAVLVEPGAMTWFDVVVPTGSAAAGQIPDDIAGSMRWLGDWIAGALRSLGVDGLAVHGGPMVTTPWSRLVCFDGVGPGEVLIEGVGGLVKLVGISQRRTRAGARFQCAVHHVWSPDALVGLLRQPRPAPGDLAPVATLSPDVAAALPATLVTAFDG